MDQLKREKDSLLTKIRDQEERVESMNDLLSTSDKELSKSKGLIKSLEENLKLREDSLEDFRKELDDAFRRDKESQEALELALKTCKNY